MSLLSSMDVSASGMNSEKLRMEVISHNIANIETTNQNGEPFRPKKVIFQEVLQSQINANNPIALTGAGVRVSAVVADDSPPIMVYDPSHPHANPEGFVAKPDINLADPIPIKL